MRSKNYQPRGTTQTRVNGYYGNPTAGDVALLAQQNQYEILSQQFVGSIEVIRNSQDITLACQNALLALAIENQMTIAQAQSYQPTATPDTWYPGLIDWKATYTAQIVYAKSQGWN